VRYIPVIITIALLGAIESLLCARIADNLTELPRHDPNQKLMAQGVANMKMDIGLVLAHVNEQPLSLIQRSGFAAILGEDAIVPTVAGAFDPRPGS
jgi:MFS superfamily sulfate permease-like transporter